VDPFHIFDQKPVATGEKGTVQGRGRQSKWCQECSLGLIPEKKKRNMHEKGKEEGQGGTPGEEDCSGVDRTHYL